MDETPAAPPLSWFNGDHVQRRRWRRYWIDDTAKGLFNTALHHALRPMPVDICSALGAAMGAAAARRYPNSDARARRLWQHLHPATDADAAIRRLWRNVGRTMAEFSVLDRIRAQRRIAIEGSEHGKALIASGVPVVVAGLHLGNWEVLALTASGLFGHLPSFYLVSSNRFEHRVAVGARRRCGIELVPAIRGNTRAAVRALSQPGGRFMMYIDELSHGRVHAPFFGRAPATGGNINYAARLAAMTGAAILPAYGVRDGDCCRFSCRFLPPIRPAGNRDSQIADCVMQLNSAIEPIVGAHADQWYYALDFRFDSPD